MRTWTVIEFEIDRRTTDLEALEKAALNTGAAEYEFHERLGEHFDPDTNTYSRLTLHFRVFFEKASDAMLFKLTHGGAA
jgi:hypothetical protein